MSRRNKHRPRGSSKAGRPRKEGERTPSGRLKPPEPNARVLADRRHLVGDAGDLAKASNPLDCALARRWLTEDQHKAGARYASAYQRAQLQMPGGSGVATIAEASQRAETRGDQLRDLSPAELAEVWDNVFNRTTPAGPNDGEGAFARWKALNTPLSPAEQAQAFMVCIQCSWPQWIVQRAAGHWQTGHEAKYRTLVSALDKLAAVDSRPRSVTAVMKGSQISA